MPDQVCPECGRSAPESRCRTCRVTDGRPLVRKPGTEQHRLTAERGRALIQFQSGACALCRKVRTLLKVDYDHETGEIRGLLCHGTRYGCNHALGAFENGDRLHGYRRSDEWQDRAKAYLADPPARRAPAVPSPVSDRVTRLPRADAVDMFGSDADEARRFYAGKELVSA